MKNAKGRNNEKNDRKRIGEFISTSSYLSLSLALLKVYIFRISSTREENFSDLLIFM